MEVTVILLLVLCISIFNLKNNKAFAFPLVISLIGILGCINVSTTFAWFNASKKINAEPVKTGIFDTDIFLNLDNNQIDLIDENTLESGKEYNVSITNIGNVSGQVKIIFGDKEYYTSVISPYNSVDMKIVPSVSGTIKYEEDWKTTNTPTTLNENVLNVGN